MKRQSGILLPIYALPSKYGCGSLGQEAYNFIDWLSDAGQGLWQILPLGPTNFGNSPYQSVSSFAGNPFFIDLDLLLGEALLEEKDLENLLYAKDPEYIDYELLIANRFSLLRKAYEKGKSDSGFASFKEENASWLSDYALYLSLKEHFANKPWTEWPDNDIRKHDANAIDKYMLLLADEIGFHSFVQYKFYEQWNKLKTYANEKGVKIMGDIPVYVPLDSSDVWAYQEFFCLDEDLNPTEVAGVPPDYFSTEGQLWNNPLYNWDKMKSGGYGWWIRRIAASLHFTDLLRIDHFRGFAAYWAVPSGEQSAKNGYWKAGPGLEFVSMLCEWFGSKHFVAEDLGIIGDDVRKLLIDSGLPGMKVLEFAFDPSMESAYLPHRYNSNCICYTGTHDNAPLAQWLLEAEPKEIEFAKEYLDIDCSQNLHWAIIKAGMRSKADLFIMQMQDALELGKEARTNVPGTIENNWRWRLLPNQLDKQLANKLNRLCIMYDRGK